jgi:1-phosphofructokinase family hexose kinase
VIVSFTPNPAVDKTLVVRGLVHGAQNRADESHVDPGGKGINVSRMAHRLGSPTLALAVLGGHIGRLLARALHDEGVPSRFVWTHGETRLNLVLVDPAAGASTRVWDRGPHADDEVARSLLSLAHRGAAGAKVFVAGGTLLPGMPADLHATALADAAKAGARTILDADGEALRLGLAGRPSLVKPNVGEVASLLGREVGTDAEVVAAGRELIDLGTEAVVVSLGARGSLLVERGRVVRAVPPEVTMRSAVGSGDSMVAGLAVAMARGDDLVEGLRLGSAAGAATAAAVGTHLGERADVERLLPLVRIETVAG